jgi:flagellin
MSSILTNSSALVALQTLRNVTSNLETVQSNISTGKKIASSRDNSAIWSIAKVMDSDISGFKGISDSLALANATLSVARNASETVQGLLEKMKGQIVTAQGENVPKDKIQTEINALAKQISSTIGAAQFSGLNFLNGAGDTKFLASLDRSASGVGTTSISVQRLDMTGSQGSIGTSTLAQDVSGMTPATATPSNLPTKAVIATPAVTAVSGGFADININGQLIRYSVSAATTATAMAAGLAEQINQLGLEGIVAKATTTGIEIENHNAFKAVEIRAGAGGATLPTAESAGNHAAPTNGTIKLMRTASAVTMSSSMVPADGQGFTLNVAGGSYTYVAGKGDTMEDVARGLKIKVDAANTPSVETKVNFNAESGSWELLVSNKGATPLAAMTTSGSTGGKATGGLSGLESIDVTTKAGAKNALENIETLINKAIDTAAQFGSAQSRIDIQAKFVKSMTDSLTLGVDSLISADIEEASARLQASQVQQQLAIQALTIANQAPQNLLSLFR